MSPILSNILLDKLDQYIEAILIPKYTKGDEKRANPAYRRLVWRAHDLHKRGKKEQVKQVRKQFRRLPSRDPNDPTYRRLRYCRYADDVRHLTRCLIPLGERRSSEEMTSGSLGLPGDESQMGN